jgi:type I restriction enzyme, S subunit
VTSVLFGDLFVFIRNGMNVSQDKSGRGIPITRIETIADAVVDGSRVGYANLRESECRGWLLQPGDILFSHINSVEHIGKCAVYQGSPAPLVHGMNLLCMRCDRSRLLPEFAKYLIRGSAFRTALSKYVKKAVNQASVSIGDLRTIRVAVPSLPDQRRVAGVLDQAEALRAKRRAALAQLDTLTQSVFVDMFGDPATNPKGWPTRQIRTLGKITTGGTPPSAKPGMFGGPTPFITPGDIESEEPAKRSLTVAGAAEVATVRAGATFVCCIGTIGKIGIATVRSAFNQQINAVEWGEAVDDRYGYWVLRFFKPTIIAWAASTTLPILKKSTFEQLEVPVPPIELQRAFSRRLAPIRGLDSSSRAAIAMLDELFRALQFRAFVGERQP